MPLTYHVCQATMTFSPFLKFSAMPIAAIFWSMRSFSITVSAGHVKKAAATRSVVCCGLFSLQFWAMPHPALCSLHSAVASSKLEGRGTSCSCYPRWVPSCDSASGFSSSSSPSCSRPVPSSSRRFAPFTLPPGHRARPSASSPDQPAHFPTAIRMRGQLLRGFGCLAAMSRHQRAFLP